ncbi:MAG: dTMP kinase [Geodermatophilaceae bacterium]
MGVAQLYVATLDAGNAGYSILFGTVFTGLALGMIVGPRILPGISRRRLFGLTIGLSGVSVLTMSLMSDFVLVMVLALLVGVFGGIAWINGYTMIGYEVEDRLRGRVFAFILSSVRIALLLSVAVGPLLAGWLGQRSLRLRDSELAFSGPSTMLLVAGLMATAVGVYAYRKVGGQGKRLADILWQTVSRPDLLGDERVDTGLFVAFEGSHSGQIAGQAVTLVERLRRVGYPVISTQEPGDTAAGRQIAAILSDRTGTPLAPATECLLYLADRAEHVATVVRPALQQRQVVVCQRYVDSSVAYQGAGRGLDPSRIRRTSQWVTGSLAPDLTVVLDATGGPGEDAAVRHMFLELADADPDHYLVLPADLQAEAIAAAVDDRVLALLATRSERVAHVVPGGSLAPAEPIAVAAGTPSALAAGPPSGTAGSVAAAG